MGFSLETHGCDGLQHDAVQHAFLQTVMLLHWQLQLQAHMSGGASASLCQVSKVE